MPLKTLDEHNEKMRKLYRDMSIYPKPNGIACPNCGKELMDSDGMMLTSAPPQRKAHCDSCGFVGYRVA